MKKIFIISLLSIAIIFAQDLRQQKNGFSIYFGSVNSSLLNTTSISKNKLSGGIGYEWYLPNNLSVTSGLLYVEKGFKKKSLVVAALGFFSDNTYNYEDINATYYYVDIPIMLNYNFRSIKNVNLKIGAGLSWLINTNQVDKLENRIIIDTSDLSEEEFRNYSYDYNFDEDPGDLSPESTTYDLNLSLGLEWLNYFINLKYSQNLSDGVSTFSLVEFKEKLKSWSFYLGYKF